MNTSYIRFHMVYQDPVWGPQTSHSGYSGLVRVTRNRLKKAIFEWVGYPHVPFDLAKVRRGYPIVMFADLPNSGDDMWFITRPVSPLPKDRV